MINNRLLVIPALVFLVVFNPGVVFNGYGEDLLLFFVAHVVLMDVVVIVTAAWLVWRGSRLLANFAGFSGPVEAVDYSGLVVTGAAVALGGWWMLAGFDQFFMEHGPASVYYGQFVAPLVAQLGYAVWRIRTAPRFDDEPMEVSR